MHQICYKVVHVIPPPTATMATVAGGRGARRKPRNDRKNTKQQNNPNIIDVNMQQP